MICHIDVTQLIYAIQKDCFATTDKIKKINTLQYQNEVTLMNKSTQSLKAALSVVSLTVSYSLIAMVAPIASAQTVETIEHSSGKCLRVQNNSSSPANGTKVVLSSNCSGPAAHFTLSAGGSIKHVPSNQCVHPGGLNVPDNGTELVLWQGCDFADRVRFDQTTGNSLQQVSSQKCVHPRGGSANPADGTALVMWDGCNESRLAFSVNTSSGNTSVDSGQSSNGQPSQQQPSNSVAGISSRAQLQAAINNSSAGDVIRISSNFSFSEEILVNKPVVIDGGGNTLNHSVPTSGAFAEFTPAFAIFSSNVTLRNLTINGSNRNGANTLVQLNNRGTTRANNFTLRNVTLRNATAGLRNQGIIPSNLRVIDNTFVNMNKAIDLTRDAALSDFTRQRTNLFDGAGDRIFYQNAGRLTITGNRFFVDDGEPGMQVGIQIDGGNDGFNHDPAPGFPNNTRANRGNNNNLIIKFNNGVIANNTGEFDSDPVRATEFPIALAKVADVTIRDNFVETVGETDDVFDFSSGINVEHMSRDVTIRDNAIAVNRVVNGQQNNQGISVLPFQDHGANADSEEATVNVRVINNDFYGAGRSGIFALAFRNLEIDGNNFNQFEPSRSGLATMNLFNTDDNGNGRLDQSERSNLVGDFVNFNATTNLGASGLVQETLFNTGDPSDLPPDLR